jgi:hypothetical protein
LYNKAKTTLVAYPGGKTGASFTIHAGVTTIYSNAFSYCTSLTSVTIGSGVTSIGRYAFNGCTSLAGITIPAGVTSIEYAAFSSCTSLTGVTIGSGVTSIGQQAFASCRSLTSVTFAVGSNIADGNFGSSAFPEGTGNGGNTLKTAYSTGKAGTYTRAAGGSTWTKS